MIVNRAEYKYNMAMDVLAWAGWLGEKRKYTEAEMRAMPVPKLEAIHREYYWKRHGQMTRIGRV